jgi:hypothetical protein
VCDAVAARAKQLPSLRHFELLQTRRIDVRRSSLDEDELSNEPRVRV